MKKKFVRFTNIVLAIFLICLAIVLGFLFSDGESAESILPLVLIVVVFVSGIILMICMTIAFIAYMIKECRKNGIKAVGYILLESLITFAVVFLVEYFGFKSDVHPVKMLLYAVFITAASNAGADLWKKS